jgi:hypothetical protein
MLALPLEFCTFGYSNKQVSSSSSFGIGKTIELPR